MRILHAMESTIGGTRRHLVDVTRGQLQRGHQVALAVSCEREPRFRGDLADLARRGAQVFEVPMRRAISPLDDARRLRELRRALASFAPEIVHTHSSKAGFLGRVASLLEGRGVRIHSPHTYAFLFSAEFGPLRRALFRRIETALAKRTRRVIAVSAGEAETFKKSGVVREEQVRVVRNGIDPAPWLDAVPLARSELGIPKDAPLILVAGLLHVAKGQDLAVEALAQPGLERAHLLVLGEGPWGAQLEQAAARLGVRARLHLAGWRDDVPRCMATCDIVLLPSRWEAMPYVVLEGMAAARAVVATRVDGAREMVVDGETGALCDVGQPASIAAALRRVIEAGPERRAEMGRRGRERLLAEGTDARMVEGLLEVYAGSR